MCKGLALSEAAGRDPKWHVNPRCAIGDYDGEIEINISGNSVSSSVLPMMESHSSAAEGSAYVGVETGAAQSAGRGSTRMDGTLN